MTQTFAACILEHRRQPERARPALDGAWICFGHREELARLITEMPAVSDDLTRANGPGGPRPPGTSGGITVDDAASRHRSHIAGVMASWARLVSEERGITPPASAAVEHTAVWLTVHVDWIAAQRWVDEMLGELRQLAGRARGIIDIPARVCETGQRCLQHADGERCEGTISIVVRGDDWTARCSACEERQDATPYLRARGRWVTRDGVLQLARIAGIPCSEDVVRQWKHRKRIKAKEEGGVTWYELGSVQTYLANRRQQEAARERIAS